MRPALSLALLLATAALAGCVTGSVPSDYRIPVVKADDGSFTPVPPPCAADRNTHEPDAFDNQPSPHFGCADARNLAMQVANPKDLVEPEPLGEADAIKATSAVDRYRRGEVWGLYDAVKMPKAIEPAPKPTPDDKKK